MDTQTTYNYTETQASDLYNLNLDDEKIALMRRTIARGASEDELALFVEQCVRTGLDPFARQIYAVRRKQWNSQTRQYEDSQVIQVSIDGFRLIADRTHKYAGQVGPWWCGLDGEWKEVWLSDEPPAAARVGVMRHDFQQPLFATALYKSYVQTNSQGDPTGRWRTDPAGMLAKCAEALGLRRAFPHQLSGLYTTEEMDQADNPNGATLNVPDTGSQEAVTEVVTGTDVSAEPVQPDESHAQKSGSKSRARAPRRPYTPEDLRANFEKAVAAIESRGLVLGPDDYAVTEAALKNLFDDRADQEKYLSYLSGVSTLEEMDESKVVALLRLLKPVSTDDTWRPGDEARTEAEAVLALEED